MSLKVRNRVVNVGYEEAERKMARDFLSPDDSVLEIGGAIGFIGLFCQKKIGIKNYITVEANPQLVGRRGFVVKRQCASNSSSRYTPNDVFVLPTSITRSICELLR